jgi:hypothetical protein
MNNRLQVLVYTEEQIADPQLDLCADCGSDVLKSSKVQRGRATARKRIENWRTPVKPKNPTGAPVDDYRPQVGGGAATEEAES